MWNKMDQSQLDEFLDNQVANYNKSRLFYFWGGSLVMLGLRTFVWVSCLRHPKAT